jgi:hypothetical protein
MIGRNNCELYCRSCAADNEGGFEFILESMPPTKKKDKYAKQRYIARCINCNTILELILNNDIDNNKMIVERSIAKVHYSVWGLAVRFTGIESDIQENKARVTRIEEILKKIADKI